MSEEKFDWFDIISNKRPVVLRNGSKAYIFVDLRDYPERESFDASNYVIRGFILNDEEERNWCVNGEYYSGNKTPFDIVGLWKEKVTIAIPKPLKEPRDKMWYITVNGGVYASGGKVNYDSERFEAGFYFATKEEAEEFLKVLSESRG